MRTNIDIDETLLKEAFQVSNARTTSEMIQEALRTLITVKKPSENPPDLRKLYGIWKERQLNLPALRTKAWKKALK